MGVQGSRLGFGASAVSLVLAVVACSGTPSGTSSPSSDGGLAEASSAPVIVSAAPSATPLPTPSATTVPTVAPVPTPTPTPRPAATPLPTATDVATHTDTPIEWYPWLPEADDASAATLEVGGFVSAVSGLVPVSAEPGGPPFRFDTGDPDPASHPLIGFSDGSLLVVVRGPVVVDGVEWYLLTPAKIAIDVPTGWSPLTASNGDRYVRSTQVDCPASPVSSARLAALTLTDGLPSCYGATQTTIVGALDCGPDVDAFVTGASWLRGGTCRFEGPPTVYGLDADLAAGRYAVTGHFLDPEAVSCRSAAGDTVEDRLAAVLHCRRAFVAMSAEPVDD